MQPITRSLAPCPPPAPSLVSSLPLHHPLSLAQYKLSLLLFSLTLNPPSKISFTHNFSQSVKRHSSLFLSPLHVSISSFSIHPSLLPACSDSLPHSLPLSSLASFIVPLCVGLGGLLWNVVGRGGELHYFLPVPPTPTYLMLMGGGRVAQVTN